MNNVERQTDGRIEADEHFVTTHWSVVIRAGRSEPQAHEALSQLCQTYWYPLYSFIRRQGKSPHDAEDLTQEFFARLLEKNYLAAAREEKGKFRTFLLTTLKRFLANEWDRQHAQKRGGFQPMVEIEAVLAESKFNSELAHNLNPDVLFERQWAITLLERVMKRLQKEYEQSGRDKLFEKLRGCLVKDDSAQPYAQIASGLNLTESAIKTAVHRLRTRYQELLRQEIGKTVATAADVEEELRQLFAAVGG
jgi:RNA polymerase sigma-70 factor (ECF subfamily)